MKIELSIDGGPHEFEHLLRALLLKQITDSDIIKAKQREEHWKKIEGNTRVSQLFVEAHERSKRKELAG
mgnify:CR=1 FL=1